MGSKAVISLVWRNSKISLSIKTPTLASGFNTQPKIKKNTGILLCKRNESKDDTVEILWKYSVSLLNGEKMLTFYIITLRMKSVFVPVNFAE